MIGFAKRAAAAVVDETTLFLQSRPRRKRGALLMVETGGAFRLLERKRGAIRPLGEGSAAEIAAACAAALRRRSVELRLDPARVVDRIIRIPGPSRLYAEAVVRHQLERITPWAANAAVFDFQEVGLAGKGAAAEIELRVVVISRTALDRIQDTCAEAGIRLDGVGVASGDIEAPSGINLAGHAKALETARLRERVRMALLGLLLFGTAAIGGSLLLADFAARQGESLARSIETTRSAAADLRRGNEAPVNPVLAMKRQDGNVPTAILVNELSRVLPVGSHLTALSIEDHQVRLTGLSNDASTLIGLVEASSIFGGVAFAAPVLRGQAGGLERFEIVASFGGPVS